MHFQKILFFILFMQMNVVVSMYRARCTPFSSLVCRTDMKDKLYKMIDEARKSLKVSIFTFVDIEAVRRLALAQTRGVKVEVIMDGASDRNIYGVKETLEEFNVPIWVYKAKQGINHNKYIIADGHKSWISSMNFTKPAYSQNLESAILVYNASIANFFTNDFQATRELIDKQKDQERQKKAMFRRHLAAEREKHEENIRAWLQAKKSKR